MYSSDLCLDTPIRELNPELIRTSKPPVTEDLSRYKKKSFSVMTLHSNSIIPKKYQSWA
jgi:hypothetical protein